MGATWDGMDEAVAVADAASFAGAAKILHVSTSHVSKVVARLESRLETQIFNRTTRRVELTDTGRAFVEQSRRLIHERDELLLMVGGSAEPNGELRITCSISLGERLVAPIVRRFTAAHPRLAVTLDLSNHIVDIVGEGYDLAIRTGEIADPRLVGRQIALRRIATCASPRYLELAGEPRSVADLQTKSCLIGTSTTWHFKDGDNVINFSPKGRWRCNNGPAIVDAALDDMGICQLPLFYIQAHQAAGRLAPVLAEFQTTSEPIWAVYPARRHLTPKVRNLVDLLEAELQGALDGQPFRASRSASS